MLDVGPLDRPRQVCETGQDLERALALADFGRDVDAELDEDDEQREDEELREDEEGPVAGKDGPVDLRARDLEENIGNGRSVLLHPAAEIGRYARDPGTW